MYWETRGSVVEESVEEGRLEGGGDARGRRIGEDLAGILNTATLASTHILFVILLEEPAPPTF